MVQLWQFHICQEKGHGCNFFFAHLIRPEFHKLKKNSIFRKLTCQIEVTTVVPSGGYHELTLYDNHDMIYIKFSGKQLSMYRNVTQELCIIWGDSSPP